MNLWGSKHLHNNQTFSSLNFNCKVRLLDMNSNKIQDLESVCGDRKNANIVCCKSKSCQFQTK